MTNLLIARACSIPLARVSSLVHLCDPSIESWGLLKCSFFVLHHFSPLLDALFPALPVTFFSNSVVNLSTSFGAQGFDPLTCLKVKSCFNKVRDWGDQMNKRIKTGTFFAIPAIELLRTCFSLFLFLEK